MPDGSFRIDSNQCRQEYDPQDPAAKAKIGEQGGQTNETHWGFPKRVPVEGNSLSLVVADVSGLHARGPAHPGKLRRTFILTGVKGARGGLPRLNPFSYAKEVLRQRNTKTPETSVVSRGSFDPQVDTKLEDIKDSNEIQKHEHSNLIINRIPLHVPDLQVHALSFPPNLFA